MSRRYTRSRGRLTRGRWTVQSPDYGSHRADKPFWYARHMPEPWDYWYWGEWDAAWAEVTVSVCHNVWIKQGARLYDVHRDPLLREDLQDWLWVKAVEATKWFVPNPEHPEPHLQWAAWLYPHLNEKSRHHFTSVVGDRRHPSGAASVLAYRSATSTDHLDEIESEGGYAVNRYALHGRSFGDDDPLSVLIRLERFDDDVSDVEAGTREIHTPTNGGPCLTNLCTRTAQVRGLCESCYRRVRKAALEDGTWQPYRRPAQCTTAGCAGEVYRKGLCQEHYGQHRAEVTPRCKESGCEELIFARGRCQRHYDAHRRSKPTPPCSIPGCEKPSATRGWCPMHYQRWRKAGQSDG